MTLKVFVWLIVSGEVVYLVLWYRGDEGEPLYSYDSRQVGEGQQLLLDTWIMTIIVFIIIIIISSSSSSSIITVKYMTRDR